MKALVKKAQRGDEEAFVMLMEICKDGMYRVAKGYFQSEVDVADAMAETVLTTYEKLGQLQKPQYFKTWLTRILINNCNRMLRERNRCNVMDSLPEEGMPDDAYANIEFYELLREFPDDCRMILLLYYGEQFTTREIADILDMNENTVRSKLRRTRAELKESLTYSL